MLLISSIEVYLFKVFFGRVVYNVVFFLVLYMDAIFFYCIEVIMVFDVRKFYKFGFI